MKVLQKGFVFLRSFQNHNPTKLLEDTTTHRGTYNFQTQPHSYLQYILQIKLCMDLKALHSVVEMATGI